MAPECSVTAKQERDILRKVRSLVSADAARPCSTVQASGGQSPCWVGRDSALTKAASQASLTPETHPVGGDAFPSKVPGNTPNSRQTH